MKQNIIFIHNARIDQDVHKERTLKKWSIWKRRQFKLYAHVWKIYLILLVLEMIDLK